MLYRNLCLIAFILTALAAQSQTSSNQTASMAPSCLAPNCADVNPSKAPVFPTHQVQGQWVTEDFKSTDSSVSCSVVKYDNSQPKPILHLLCPGPQVFAPLRVHLSLTWKQISDIPAKLQHMLVRTDALVKFKSKKGESKAELTMSDPQAGGSSREWVSFNSIEVGLVLPNEK
ncbi:MAG TPA: hypothetical protein VE783_03710 [Candidatus Limnocylindrales bacterium]|nr:hypothetical protein [Candidatus Limnocylindrales bacterium]